jgi:TPR repeat protein
VQSADAAGVFNADTSKAWSWYQKGADAGEPNTLARFAERDERNALVQTDALKRNAQLLQAFALYAAAAERAREEDWPDGAWKGWRYRRATLARLLAREGMMQQVADAYAAMLEKAAPRSPSLLQRFAASWIAITKHTGSDP